MSVKIMCDLFRDVFLKSFVHMWSISVVLVSVILVGLVMRGLNDAAVYRSWYDFVCVWISIFIKL